MLFILLLDKHESIQLGALQGFASAVVVPSGLGQSTCTDMECISSQITTSAVSLRFPIHLSSPPQWLSSRSQVRRSHELAIACMSIEVANRIAAPRRHCHDCMSTDYSSCAGNFVGKSNVSTTVYNGMGFNHSWNIDADAGTVLQCSKVFSTVVAWCVTLPVTALTYMTYKQSIVIA